MELYLIRHAIAEDALPGQSDSERPLSERGVQNFMEVVRGLRRLNIKFDRLYHSPKLRAVQTADLLTPLLAGETIVTPYLAAAPGPELLQALAGESVALVGHEPWISELAGWLLTAQPTSHSPFKKGGVAALEGQPRPGGMKLTGFWSPRVLRRLA